MIGLLKAACLLICLVGIHSSSGQSSNAYDDVCQREQEVAGNLWCPDSMQCFPSSELCNGNSFCVDDADEGSHASLDCDGSKTGRKIPRLTCVGNNSELLSIELQFLCDGTDHCLAGEDESNDSCAMKDTLKSYICSNGSTIELSQLCDGVAHCPDGDDETSTFCANKCMFPYYGGCPYSRECQSTAVRATCGLCRPGYARDPMNYTIGECVDALFKFERQTYSTRECNRYLHPRIRLGTTGVLDQTVIVSVQTVEQSTADRQATANTDYRNISQDLTFSAFTGSGSKSLTLEVIPDNVCEGAETFQLEASISPPGWNFSLGGDTATVQINECQASIRFNRNNYHVSESAKSLIGYVVLDAGTALEKEVTVVVETKGLSATANVDYGEIKTTLTFPQSSLRRASLRFSVPIFDDDFVESFDETFRLTTYNSSQLGNSNCASIITGDTATGRIQDNDAGVLDVEYEHQTYTVMEGTELEVCFVNKSNPVRSNSFLLNLRLHTSYDLSNTGADAIGDLDYEPEYGKASVTFTQNTTRECHKIQIYRDDLNEPLEKFLVHATVRGRGRLSQRTAEVYISNDDETQAIVSIEHPNYSTVEGETLEVCVVVENGQLDTSLDVNLQLTDIQSVKVTLSLGSTRSCGSFEFLNGDTIDNVPQSYMLEAIVVQRDSKVSLGRSSADLLVVDNDGLLECPNLPNPTNGIVDILLSDGPATPGSLARYSCNPGFMLVGKRFRTCADNRLWSGDPPSCERETSILDSSANEFVLGFIRASGFLVVTTDEPGTVCFVVTSGTNSYTSTVTRSSYRTVGVNQQVMHIRAEGDKRITVHGWTNSRYSYYDPYLALSPGASLNVLEYEYYTVPYDAPSSLLIVAGDDETLITTSADSRPVTLKRFQTHQIDNIPISKLSAVRVTSSKPVSVYSAKACNTNTCDQLVEQMQPTATWGIRFLVGSFSGLKSGESLRIISSNASTTVSVSCPETNEYELKNSGDWMDVKIDSKLDVYCSVEATSPISVFQFAQVSEGNSYFMTIPSVDHYSNNYANFYIRYRTGFDYITIYVLPRHFQPELISVDGFPVLEWFAVQCSNGDTCGYVARPPLRTNTHNHFVHHLDPSASIGISAYGFDGTRNNSYGYPVGLRQLAPQRLDECVPGAGICGEDGICMEVMGYFECVCNDGYARDEFSILCSDIDECVTDSNDCSPNAQCTNTKGGFNCTCNPGFNGTDGTVCTTGRTFIEGQDYIKFVPDISGGDKLEGKDDSCSRPITVSNGLPFGSSTQTVLRVCDNGVISVGDSQFTFWYPQRFPSDNPLISQSNVIAPFWNDNDLTIGDGRVFYQVYKSESGDKEQTKLKEVSTLVEHQQGRTFSGRWMLIAEWSKVSPFFSGAKASTLLRNTYQAIVITNYIQTYAVFIYNLQDLNWFSTRGGTAYTVIGYNIDQRTTRFLNIPSFQNHRHSGTVHIESLVSSTFNTSGLHLTNLVYLVGEARDPQQLARAECMNRKDQDLRLFLSRSNKPDLPCPCTVNQAFRDRRYTHASKRLVSITGDTSFNSRNCFVQAFRQARSTSDVQLCCYSTSPQSFGALLDSSHTNEASSLLRYNPFWDPESYVQYDYLYKESCCFEADSCKSYTDQRPSDNCLSYMPSRFAWCWGDPHITTLDGGVYTFNGWGEYTLLELSTEETSFLLQGRTHPVVNSTATQLVAFAFGTSKNSPVEIGLSADTNTLNVFVNGSDITGNVSMANETFQATDVIIIRESSSSLVCTFPNGISVTVSASSAMLAFVLEVPDSFRNITRGLMGNNNGIAADDVVYRNGTMLAHNVSDRLIHEVGQSWEIEPDNSMFTYPDGLSASDYSHPDHIPAFLDEVVSTANEEILDVCGASLECIYDATQTGDINIGLETMTTNIVNIEFQQQATNNPPIILGPSTLLIVLGEVAELVFTVTDDKNIFDVSLIGGLPVNSTLTPVVKTDFTEFIFRWDLHVILNASLMFAARDELDAVSVLNVQVQICACQNGGNCTLAGLLSTTANTIILNCDCPQAWEGRFCSQDVDGCREVICFEGSTCVDMPAPAVGAMCGPCPDGYLGDGEKCDDVNECDDGSHNCADICVNNVGGFECACSLGYRLMNATHCEDIDECSMLNGDCHQVCNNLIGGFSCGCQQGYELSADNRTCHVLPESACDDDTQCSQNCVRLFSIDQCSCVIGYELADDDTTCTDINECEEHPCDHVCTNVNGGFECSCEAGYELSMDGVTCLDIDECALATLNDSSICPSAMFCTNVMGGFVCECPGGTIQEGQRCIPIVTEVRRVNDTIIGNPVMTVPLYLANASALGDIHVGDDQIMNLCFEVFGESGQYFNLVSDSCVSVNAHYVQPVMELGYNILDELTVKAVGLDGICHDIAVTVKGCQAVIDDTPLTSPYSSAGIAVRMYRNRVRIAVPNCQNIDLIMWIFCEKRKLRGDPDLGEPDITAEVDMIHFVIARGVNIRETAHGILGQFWNVPISVQRYTGPLYDGSVSDNAYIITIRYPGKPPRRFISMLDSPVWDTREKEFCLYAGNSQGGSVAELASPNDPVIEGDYTDYLMSESFGVEFIYSHFESSECRTQ